MSGVTVRLAEDTDERALVRLAALDSADVPVRPTLLAELDGRAVAAAPVSGGAAIADPFMRTVAIVQLLELRAAQLRGEAPSRAGRLRELMRPARALSLR